MICRWRFRRAVRAWCQKVRRHRWLIVRIKDIQADICRIDTQRAKNPEMAENVIAIGVFLLEASMEEYRKLDDEIRKEAIFRRLSKRLGRKRAC